MTKNETLKTLQELFSNEEITEQFKGMIQPFIDEKSKP